MRIAAGRFACGCGCDLGAATSDWKRHAITRCVDPASYGPHVRTHAELELREHACPDCGSLLEAEVVRKGEASLNTLVLAGDTAA